LPLVPAATTGLRQGELIGLRWRDVDLSARRLRVVSPLVRGEFGDPKSESSGRSVPLAERVAHELEKHRQRSAYATDQALVFYHPETGRPLDRSKLTGRFKQGQDARRYTRSPITSYATHSEPLWRRPACLCARSSTGWATRTPRPLRSTPTTSQPRIRQRSCIRTTDLTQP
jgi:integrase